MHRLTGQGLELHGDGLKRAQMRVNAAEHTTVTDFVESVPGTSLVDLADRLNRSDSDADPLPISADHLARLLAAPI